MSTKLKIDINEQEDFIKEGFERIKTYYSLPLDERESETGLLEPPHEMLLESSSKFIELGFNNILNCTKLNSETNWSDIDRREFDYILIGIGTEILLKAIFLKQEPNIFIKLISFNKNTNTYQTPGFNKCKKQVIDFLSPILSPTHLERVKDILELIQLKRNNLVHLSFHRMSNYREDYQVANVLKFLFVYFFNANPFNIVEKLDEAKEKTKVINGIDYEPVEFDEF